MADTKIVVNCETGEVTEVELTAEEIAQREQDRIAFEAEQTAKEAEAKAIADAKASANAKLAALGLTEQEIQALTK